ncbi:MAG: aminotransferase class V-fold PLP-dependent enzyme [Verrucomicrobiota bacterium]
MPYFDHNATSPLAAVAREAWLRVNDEFWHNPSSPTRAGARARLQLNAARDALAALLRADAKQIVFNSGATEGAHAVLAHWATILPADATIAINPTEHPCVLAAATKYFPQRTTPLPLDADGVVTPAALEAALDAGAHGVIVMAANNETGVIQPWAVLAERCRQRGAPYLCDATQWFGKLPADSFGATGGWVLGSAHKFGGARGNGFILAPADAIAGFHGFTGGEQENGHRAGTEDIAGIRALTAALFDCEQHDMHLESARLLWREAFERAITTTLTGSIIIAAKAERLWNTVALIPPRHANTRWVARLDKLGYQVSTGSACATGKDGPSHVLAALGVDPLAAQRVVRISAGRETTAADWQELAAAFANVAAALDAEASTVI